MFIRALMVLGTKDKYGNGPISPGYAAEVDDAVGKKLVAAGVAVEVALPTASGAVTGENPIAPVKGAEGAIPGETDDTPKAYSTAMSVTALRAAMKENGFTVKVGMTKQQMVDTLNGDVPPELSAQDVIDE